MNQLLGESIEICPGIELRKSHEVIRVTVSVEAPESQRVVNFVCPREMNVRYLAGFLSKRFDLPTYDAGSSLHYKLFQNTNLCPLADHQRIDYYVNDIYLLERICEYGVRLHGLLTEKNPQDDMPAKSDIELSLSLRVSPSRPPHTTPVNQILSCPACGKEMPSGAFLCNSCHTSICINCRAPLRSRTQTFQCSNPYCENHGKLLCRNCLEENISYMEPYRLKEQLKTICIAVFFFILSLCAGLVGVILYFIALLVIYLVCWSDLAVAQKTKKALTLHCGKCKERVASIQV